MLDEVRDVMEGGGERHGDGSHGATRIPTRPRWPRLVRSLVHGSVILTVDFGTTVTKVGAVG